MLTEVPLCHKRRSAYSIAEWKQRLRLAAITWRPGRARATLDLRRDSVMHRLRAESSSACRSCVAAAGTVEMLNCYRVQEADALSDGDRNVDAPLRLMAPQPDRPVQHLSRGTCAHTVRWQSSSRLKLPIIRIPRASLLLLAGSDCGIDAAGRPQRGRELISYADSCPGWA